MPTSISVEDTVLLHRRQIFLQRAEQSRQSQIHVLLDYRVCPCSISHLLDHTGDILVQVAAVELHQIYEDMEKIGRQAYVHPQEDKSCWRAGEQKMILQHILRYRIHPDACLKANWTPKCGRLGRCD